MAKGNDEILDLMREAQELGRALSESADSLTEFAMSAQNSLSGLSSATEEGRKRISQLYSELEKGKSKFAGLLEDYSSAYVISQNYFNRLKREGKDVSGLAKTSAELEKQHKQLLGILDLLRDINRLMPNLGQVAQRTTAPSPVPTKEQLQEDLAALVELQGKMSEAGTTAQALGQKVVDAMNQGKATTAEGRQEISLMVAGFRKAQQEYAVLASKFNNAQYQMTQGLEDFERNGGKVTQELVVPLEEATEKARALGSSLRSISGSISQAVSGSPDLAGEAGTRSMAKENVKVQEQLNSVFSDQNRILQENRALLAQDQEYMKLVAEVNTSAEGSMRQMNAQMKIFKMELENLSPTEANAKAMDELRDKINALDTAIRRSSADQRKHIINISEFGEATAFVASDIRRAIQGLTQIRMKMGEVDTSTEEGRIELGKMVEEYQRLTKEIGDLKREYNTIKTTTQALGSQAGIVANIGSAVTATTAGVQALMGAMNLAGADTKEWGNALVKLQSIMAITNGLTMVYNNLLKTGRLYVAAENITLKVTQRLINLRSAALGSAIVAETANTEAIVAETAAQEANNVATETGVAATEAGVVATEEATGASIAHSTAMKMEAANAKILSFAMKAGPLIILTAILAAVAAVVKWATKVNNAWKKPVEQAKVRMNQLNEAIEAQEEHLSRLAKVQKKVIGFYKELAEASHAYYTTIQQMTGQEWVQDAELVMAELRTAMDKGLISVEGLKEALDSMGTDVFHMAEWNELAMAPTYFGEIGDAIEEVNRKAGEYGDEVDRLKEKILSLKEEHAFEMDRKVSLRVAFGMEGYLGRMARMSWQEVLDLMESQLKARESKLNLVLNLKTNLPEIVSKFLKIQEDNKWEELEVENTVLQAQRDANLTALENIQQRFERERALAAENTQAEIEQLEYRKKTEQDLGEAGRAALNKKIGALQRKLNIELREIQEEENAANLKAFRDLEDAKWAAAKDSHSKRRALLKLESEREIEDLDIRLATEQDLTKKEIESIKLQRIAAMSKYVKEAEELEKELQQELIAAEKSRLELRSSLEREATDDAFNYAKQALVKEMQAELLAREQMSEEEKKLAASDAEIRLKYARLVAKAELDYQSSAAQRLLDARQRWERAYFNEKEKSVREIAEFENYQQIRALRAERERYAEEYLMESKLIDLKLASGLITEEEAKAQRQQLEDLIMVIEAIDKELAEKLKKNLDLEYSNIWELLGMDKKKAGAFKVFVDSLKDSLSEALDAWADYYAERTRLAEQALDNAKSEYEVQQELRAQGYANSVETARREMAEKKKLRDQALREERRAEAAQEALNTAEEASELALAVAKVFSAFGMPLGAIMSGAMIAAFIGAKASAASAANAKAKLYKEGTVELLEGGSHASGNDISLGYDRRGNERRAEGGEFFAVINKRNSRKYRSVIPDVINSLNDGTFGAKYQRAFGNTDEVLSVINAGSGQDWSSLKEDVRSIREQGDSRSYVDQQGNLIKISRGITRKILKR